MSLGNTTTRDISGSETLGGLVAASVMTIVSPYLIDRFTGMVHALVDLTTNKPLLTDYTCESIRDCPYPPKDDPPAKLQLPS
jgi:hypothetical protein